MFLAGLRRLEPPPSVEHRQDAELALPAVAGLAGHHTVIDRVAAAARQSDYVINSKLLVRFEAIGAHAAGHLAQGCQVGGRHGSHCSQFPASAPVSCRDASGEALVWICLRPLEPSLLACLASLFRMGGYPFEIACTAAVSVFLATSAVSRPQCSAVFSVVRPHVLRATCLAFAATIPVDHRKSVIRQRHRAPLAGLQND